VLRSNFGLELWLGNNPDVTDTSAEWQHPNTNFAEGQKYKRMGEIAYMAAKEQEAFAFMRTHPGITLNLLFHRFVSHWLAFSDSPADVWENGTVYSKSFLILNCLLSVLCLLGALYAHRSGDPEAFLFAMVLLVFPLVFYMTHASMRYRFPVDPIMLILAVGALAHLLSLARSRNPNVKKAAGPVSSLPAL
jgi:hypothetical protein